MADAQQYLRIALEDAEFLLPSEASVSIEQRDQLTVDTQGAVTAWREVRGSRWPAFYLGADLRLARGADWQRAIFLDYEPYPLGLIADEVQLMPRAEVQIEPFYPPGPRATPVGPLFSGAWMRDQKMVLVFEPNALVSYLHKLWNA